LCQLASRILAAWRGYSNEKSFIFAETDGEPHNTITPIARKREGKFELDLVLRNNITSKEHPMGVYHPHAELHHIKKENIGLIEVMGLAVLPARLVSEMEAVADAIINKKDLYADDTTAKHAPWAEEVVASHPELDSSNVNDILNEEIGKVFCKVLEHAGVYKRTEEGMKAFIEFTKSV
jgi:UDPglucose--hexose-1-phosphate uridylyltransferase